MQVRAINQNQYMNQMHQMNQVRGQGNGQGQGGGPKGMGAVMKNLSQDQREEISSMLQSLPQEDRKSVVEQIKSLDVNNMSQDDLYNSIMNILNPQNDSSVVSASAIDTYD